MAALLQRLLVRVELTGSSTTTVWTCGCKAKCTLGTYSGFVVFLIIWRVQTQNGFWGCWTIWEKEMGIPYLSSIEPYLVSINPFVSLVISILRVGFLECFLKPTMWGNVGIWFHLQTELHCPLLPKSLRVLACNTNGLCIIQPWMQ